MKTLLTFHDAAADSTERLGFSTQLAQELGAHLTTLSMTVEPNYLPTAEAHAFGQVWMEQLEAVRKEALELAQSAEKFIEKQGVQPDCRNASLPLAAVANTAARHARYADIAILGDALDGPEASLREEVFDGALFYSGRPVLVAPPGADAQKMLQKTLIAWDGGMHAARAIGDALPLLLDSESVSVIVVADKSDAEAYGEEPGGDIALHLARHGIKVDVYQAAAGQRSVGKVIADRAREIDAGMIVMGGFGQSRFREFLFGGATQELLENAPLPLFMAH